MAKQADKKPAGLYAKLLEIQKHVDKFVYDKDGHNYKYTKGSTVLGAIRPLMNEYGLLLKQEVLSLENTREDYQTKYGIKTEILSKVELLFTWIDTDTNERDINQFYANGFNDWDKGLGSALTYAERYFLLKFFHIPTDEDDVDSKEKTQRQQQAAPQQKPAAKPAAKTTPKQTLEDAKKIISASKTLAELSANWSKIKAHQGALTTLKDELKTKLTPKT